jgi:hypothetical protein
MTERLHAMIASACLGRDEASLGDLRAHLARHGVGGDDAEAILAAPRRLGLYRRLVRYNVTSVSETMLKRTRDRMEAIAKGAFADTIDAFLEEVGPRTPHLRDVPSELLAFAAPRWRADARLPPWLVDYATLELLDFTIGVAPRPGPPPPVADVSADRALVFADPKTLVRLAWAVHELDDGDASPEARDVAILVYRDAEHATRFLELTPLAGAILERLFGGATLADAMIDACKVHGASLDEAVLGGAARMLADLAERGVLLGARA